MGKIIGVLSLKGGVGKTSSVISLGACLFGLGKKVLLVDGNLSMPNLGVHLNLVDVDRSIHHVLNNSMHIHEAIHSLDFFDVIPAKLYNGLNINPLKLKDKLKSLKSKYDVILLDSSPALDDETLGVILASDEILIVSTPDYPSLSNCVQAIRIAKKRGVPITGIILNRVYNKNFELNLGEVERTSGVPVMALIPHDVGFVKSLKNFTPFAISKPNSKAISEYRKLAAVLVGEKYTAKKSLKDIFKSLNPPREQINREIFYESLFK